MLSGDGLGSAAAHVVARIEAADADRVLLLGFSQGGAVAVELLRLAPGRFARTVLLSAFLRAPERDDDAVAVIAPSAFWGRGDADPVFDRRSLAGTERWPTRCTTPTGRVYPGLTHGVSEREISDVAAFLA